MLGRFKETVHSRKYSEYASLCDLLPAKRQGQQVEHYKTSLRYAIRLLSDDSNGILGSNVACNAAKAPKSNIPRLPYSKPCRHIPKFPSAIRYPAARRSMIKCILQNKVGMKPNDGITGGDKFLNTMTGSTAKFIYVLLAAFDTWQRMRRSYSILSNRQSP